MYRCVATVACGASCVDMQSTGMRITTRVVTTFRQTTVTFLPVFYKHVATFRTSEQPIQVFKKKIKNMKVKREKLNGSSDCYSCSFLVIQNRPCGFIAQTVIHSVFESQSQIFQTARAPMSRADGAIKV